LPHVDAVGSIDDDDDDEGGGGGSGGGECPFLVDVDDRFFSTAIAEETVIAHLLPVVAQTLGAASVLGVE
jgi:hypothetical protein